MTYYDYRAAKQAMIDSQNKYDPAVTEGIATAIENNYHNDDRLLDWKDCLTVLQKFLDTGILAFPEKRYLVYA